jgi:glycosyltransferase involved in cell wall biosynthesis
MTNNYSLRDSVFFLGFREQHILRDFYCASDALLLTSNFEGMPMCVLEALACGLPVVSTDVGEVRRVVVNGYNGEIVDSFDTFQICQGLCKVLALESVYKKNHCLESITKYTADQILNNVYKVIESF